MKTWVITDIHVGHRKIIDYEYRPVDYEEQIISNFNRLVGHDDLVINLGDFSLTGSDRTKDFFNRLRPCRHVLVRGNHCSKAIGYYMNMGFSFCCDRIDMTFSNYNIAFTHKPISDIIDGINVHGHEHSKGVHLYDKHIRLSIEEEQYAPVLLEQLVDRYNKWRTR